MIPSFAALAVYVLGQVGYTPKEIKYRIPLYEINQIIHVHLIQNGTVMEWCHYEVDEELNLAFEELKTLWQSEQQ